MCWFLIFPIQEDGTGSVCTFPCFYVKRCIGIPGDSLQIKGGFYEINGRRGIGNLNDQEMAFQLSG